MSRSMPRFAALALPVAAALCIPPACAEQAAQRDAPSAFDENMLRARGIDPVLANVLHERPRFSAGSNRVTLIINGQRMGRVTAHFDQNGELCIDDALLHAARLVVPRRSAGAGGPIGCRDFLAAYPQTIVEQRPEELALSIVVPTSALQEPERIPASYSRGGKSAVFNYELLGLQSDFGRSRSRYWSASTELGFNAGDWIVRSRQIHTSLDGSRNSARLESYAQRTFVEQQGVLQLGQINLYNPALAGARILGAQWTTEQALASQTRAGVAVTGIAQSQARVEVKQDNVLVHSTVVPAGPFSLSGIRRLNSRSDVQVTVYEQDGRSHQFIVPAALAGIDMPAPGYSIGAGKLRDDDLFAAPARDHWVASAGWTGPLTPDTFLSAGTTVASDYGSIGAGITTQPWSGAQVQVTLQGARTASNTVGSGVQATLGYSQQVSDAWSINASSSRRSRSYRDILEAYSEREGDPEVFRHKSQHTVGGSWRQHAVGALGASYSNSRHFDGGAAERAIATWARMFGRASFSLTAEWVLRGKGAYGNSIHAHLSMPLEHARRLRTSARHTNDSLRTGISVSEQVSDQFNYRAGLEHDSRSGQTTFLAGATALPRYTQIDLGYTRSDRSASTLQAGARGGVAWHADGITLSPYRIQDTFAVVSVADIAGVKLSTPGGPVWTDMRGRAVAGQLMPFSTSVIEVAGKSLPRNVDIGNGVAVVKLARGAVERVKFEATRTRRLLLKVNADIGTRLPKDAPVTSNGQLVTLVQGSGDVFLPAVEHDQTFWIELPEQKRCQLLFELPVQASSKTFYQTLRATCALP